MNSNGENQKLEEMKKLLTSWNVEILYELFKEEDITINELKMMQFCHINALLTNYKMGIKIRFEYHFNNWRNKIGIPLKPTNVSDHLTAFPCNYKANYAIESYNMQNAINDVVHAGGKRKRINQNGIYPNHIAYEENQPPLSPQSVQSNHSLINVSSATEIEKSMPAPILESPNEKTNNTDDETEMENLPLNNITDLLSEAPPKFPSKSTPEKCPVSLNQILQMSGSRGMSILKFYEEKNHLTNIKRSQLIQIIVDFFDHNDYHLSLNMSHNLEWEIIKMFPTEKLEYYRTEKRGKIYVKFSNMKRYKRERCNKMRTEFESLNSRVHRLYHNENNNETNHLTPEFGKNASTENNDVRYSEPEIEIEIKDENLSDI